MSSEQKAGEQRILISASSLLADPKNEEATASACFIALPDPVNDTPANYLLGGNVIQECNTYRPRFASWFIDNAVISEGALHLATLIDPLFIIIPALEKARRAGTFCDLEQCLENLRAEPGLTPLLIPLFGPNGAHLACVCDAKETGNQIYYRLNDDRLLAWLRCKVAKTKAALALPGSPFAEMDDVALSVYAVGLLTEYVSSEWSQKLFESLELPNDNGLGACKAGAPAGYNPDTIMFEATAGADAKRPRLDPKEAAKVKAAESKAAAKAAKLAKEAAGMRKLSSFFQKK